MADDYKQQTTIDIGGGVYVEGNVHVGRDFVGRDKIIHLTFKFLQEPKQQAIALGLGLIISFATYGIQWWNKQPMWMNGDFNVAIAEFKQPPSDSSNIATMLSQDLTDYLQSEYQLKTQSVDVQITHKNIEPIAEINQAEQIARKTNAHLVIYGTVSVIGNQATLQPKFYVSERFRQDIGEINHAQELAMSIPFTVAQTLDAEGVRAEMHKRSKLLAEFTRGLVYAHSGDYALALPSFEVAIESTNGLYTLQDHEILYLFASDAARRLGQRELAMYYIEQALLIEPFYARAYIALANIQYDLALLDAAQLSYEKALQMRPKADESNIFEKAQLGIGNVYHNRGLRVAQGSAEQKRWFAKAVEQFAIVIAAVQDDPQTWQQSWELAAHAQYGLGRIYQTQGELPAAEQAYQQALQWTHNVALRSAIAEWLQNLYS